MAAAPDLAVLTGGIWPHQTNFTSVALMSKAEIKDACLGGSVGSNNNWFRALEIMARAYLFNESKHYHSSDVLARIVAGIDFYQLAQGFNGGFDPRPRLRSGWIGAPMRRNGSGCLEGYGQIGLSAAVDLIAGELSTDVYEKKVDADDTGVKTMTRRAAWTRLLVNSRDYLQVRRHLTEMINIARQFSLSVPPLPRMLISSCFCLNLLCQ